MIVCLGPRHEMFLCSDWALIIWAVFRPRIHLARWKLFRSNVKWIITQLSSCCKGAESSFLSISAIGYRTLSQDVIQVGKSRFVDLGDEVGELLLKSKGRSKYLDLFELRNVRPCHDCPSTCRQDLLSYNMATMKLLNQKYRIKHILVNSHSKNIGMNNTRRPLSIKQCRLTNVSLTIHRDVPRHKRIRLQPQSIFRRNVFIRHTFKVGIYLRNTPHGNAFGYVILLVQLTAKRSAFDVIRRGAAFG